MALFLPPGVEPETEEERADLDAINALRESAAYELKDKGNEYVKMGKKHYTEAMDCYTRAIDQKIADPQHNSICHANRAHVHLLLGNNRRGYEDAKEAIRLNDKNVKGYFRGAKAALALGLLPEAFELANQGLQIEPHNIELTKLGEKAKELHDEEDAKKMRAAKAVKEAERLATVLEGRDVKIGKAIFNQMTKGRKPWLDKNAMLHWPVLLLHGQSMTSDFIEDFFEMDMFNGHLDIAYGEDAPKLLWDKDHDYTRKRIELYYLSNAEPAFSKKQVVQWLLEDGVGAGENDDEDNIGFKKQTWVKVDERATLHSVISRPDHVVPGVPVFFVVATGTSFYRRFLSGEWSLP